MAGAGIVAQLRLGHSMSIRYLVGSLFLIAGCSAAVLTVAAMVTSMQLDTGKELLAAVGALGGAALSLLFGVFVLFFRR